MRAGADRRAASASALASDRPITAIGGMAMHPQLPTPTLRRLAMLTPRWWNMDTPDGAAQTSMAHASMAPAVRFTPMNPTIRTGRVLPTKLTPLVPATVGAGLALERAPSLPKGHARAR